MSNLINEYIDILVATRHTATSTKSMYISELLLFKGFVNKGLVEVEQKDVLAYFSDLQNKIQGSTVNKKKRIIKSFYTWLEDQEKIDRSPFYRLKFKIKNTHKTYKILSIEEIRSMLIDGNTLRKISRTKSKSAFRRLRGQCVIRIFLATGIRRKELVGLEIQDCNIKDRFLLIRNTKTKNDRKVYIDRDTAIWLEIYLNRRLRYARGSKNVFINFEGDYLDDDRIDGIIDFRFWRAGLKGKFNGIKHGKGMGTHTFRRTWATHALRNGADLKTIQLLLGHSDIATTAKYLFPSEEDLKKSYDKTNILDNMKIDSEKTKTMKRRKKRKATTIKTAPKPSTPKFDEGLL